MATLHAKGDPITAWVQLKRGTYRVVVPNQHGFFGDQTEP